MAQLVHGRGHWGGALGPQEGQHFACTQSRPQGSDCTTHWPLGWGAGNPLQLGTPRALYSRVTQCTSWSLGAVIDSTSVLSPLNCPKSHKLPMLIATIPQLRLLDPHPSKAMPTAAFPSYPLYTDSRMIFGHHHARATPPSPEGKVEGSQPCTQGAQGSSQWEPATPDSSASLTSWDPDAKWLNAQPELAGHSFTPTPSLEGPVCLRALSHLSQKTRCSSRTLRPCAAHPCAQTLLTGPPA